MEEIYPHFIVDKPLGEDFFEGQSQSKLAENISYYIRKVDDENTNKESLPRIIGIEGSWGSGKSNVVTKLDNKLKNLSYYIYL